MAHFYTEFPLDKSIDISFTSEIICEWIMGMEHSSLNLNEVASDDEVHVLDHNESLQICRISSEANVSVAGRYERTEDNGRHWTTEIVVTAFGDKVLMSTRVLCESKNPEEHLPTPYRPHIVKMFMKRGLCGIDGGLKILETPHILNKNHIDLAINVIRGLSTNILPVVYVSAGFGADGFSVDANKIAKNLAGLAHVVVEPNRTFSNRLAISTERQNAYGGAVGVYWPDGAKKRIYRIGDRYRQREDLEKVICTDIIRSLANRRGNPICSWQYVREQIAARKVQELKDKNSTDATAYCAAFDAENDSLKQQLAEANLEIKRLKAENSGTEIDDDDGAFVKISIGSERNYFPDEIRSTLLSFLRKSRNQAAEGSRKQHIIDAVVSANQCVDGGPDIERKIKNTLFDCKDLSKKVRRELTDVGFEIEDDRRHHKLIYMGDERYTFTMSKTASDHRSGKNLASDICRKLF